MHPFFIDREGFWRTQQYSTDVLIGIVNQNRDSEKHLFPFSYSMIDCWFPLIHGRFGEDGQLQNQLEKTELPYIGSDERVSLNCYDKIKSRLKAKSKGICQPEFMFFKCPQYEPDKSIQDNILEMIGMPCFIKPSKTGSSFGISKVKKKDDIIPAILLALKYDNNIIVEKAIEHCMEYEIAFFGKRHKRLSLPGTVEYKDPFYTTKAKYSNETTILKAQKQLDQAFQKHIYTQTQKIIDLFNVKDLGRVDFLFDKKNDILYWNEINTIPGFTEKSMFPFLWEEEGLSLVDVIDLIIAEALY